MPYGLMYQGPPDPEQQEESPEDLVARLLESLEMEPSGAAPTPPPRVGAGRDIMGSLGDALLSQASVRAGGGPVAMGPFAAGQRQTERDYQERLMEFQKRQTENEAANRTLRNSARMIGLRSGRPSRFKDSSGFLPARQMFRDESGKTWMSVTQMGTQGAGETSLINLDPNDTTASPIGQLVPLNPAPTTVQTGRGVEVFDPRRAAAGVDPLKPTGQFPAPSEEAQRGVGNFAGFRQGLSRFKELLPTFIKQRGGVTGSGGRLGQQVVRRTPIIGPQLSERLSKEGEDIASIRARVMGDYVRIMSGLQASETEQKRLGSILPDLWTVDAATALSKIDEFERGVLSYARERARLRPDLYAGLSDEDKAFLGPISGGETEYLEPQDLEDETTDTLLEELWSGGQ